MSAEEEKKIAQHNDEDVTETQTKRITFIDESELSLLNALIHEAIGRGEITIDKEQAGFIIKRGNEVFTYNGQDNQEFFQNLEEAAQKFGRVEPTKTQKEE